MGYEPMTIAALADHLTAAGDLTARLRLVSEFCLEYSHEVHDVRQRLIADPPHHPDARWQALCEALAEHVAAIDGLQAPPWLTSHPPSLAPWWFPLENPRWQAQSIVTSPMAFRRRGIFVPGSFFEAA